MKCEFEEKQFEQSLNYALARQGNLIYPPGQVLENKLGFDAAIYADDPVFWVRFFPRHSLRPRGLRIDRRWWRDLDENIDDYFPTFKYNVFIQHKRPEYMTSLRNRAGKYWKKPYYRYKLTKHQQKALERLEDQVGNKGLVVYASPAFHQYSALWQCLRNGAIVAQTNFVQPSKLRRHSTFTYTDATSAGRAYSEPEDIQNLNFAEQLQSLSQQNDITYKSNREFVNDIGRRIDGLVRDSDLPEYMDVYSQMTNYLAQEILQDELATNLINVDVFCFLNRTTWRIGI